MIKVIVEIKSGVCTHVAVMDNGKPVEFEVKIIDHDSEEVGEAG